MAVHAHQRGVAERVAERRHLPVEDGDAPWSRRRRPASCCRCGSRRARSRCGSAAESPAPSLACSILTSASRGSSSRLDQVPLRTPPPHLALEVAGGLAEVAEPDGVRVDRVQVGEHLDQCVDARFDGAPCRRAPRAPRCGAPPGPARSRPSGTALRARSRRCASSRRGRPGTGVSASAATTLYSRAMSCADGVSPCSGGRRSTHLRGVVEDQERQVGPAAGDRAPRAAHRCAGRPVSRRCRSSAPRSRPSRVQVTGLVYHR